MTNEPKPLDLPPWPDWLEADGRPKPYTEQIDNLEAWGSQLAEIAQAQAALADGLAEALERLITASLGNAPLWASKEATAALAKYRENRYDPS